MAAGKKILSTNNYDLFHESATNRPTDLDRHRALEASMKEYGFLQCYPIVCVRDKAGRLVVKDGQHRLAVARELGLIVYYVESEQDFDVPMINGTGKPWTVRDYAEVHAAAGRADYRTALDFAAAHGIPLSFAASMLAGVASFGGCKAKFLAGTFQVQDKDYADRVATLYARLAAMSSALKNARFVQACMAVCRVAGFDQARMVKSAARCRDKLLGYTTQDAYLGMLEEVYNFGAPAKALVGLKACATQAMRERNPATRGK